MASIGQSVTNANTQPTPAYIGNITSSTGNLDVFTVGNLQISSVITGAINLVKSGPGVLDLGTGNDQTNKGANTFTGITVINQGTVIVFQETQLGNRAELPGGKSAHLQRGPLEGFLRASRSARTAGSRWARKAGPSWVSRGVGDNIDNPITGTGGITLWTDGFLSVGGGTAGRMQINNATSTANNYKGPTNFLVTPDYSGNGSTASTIPANATATQGSILFGIANNIPSTTAVTANLVDYTGGNVLPNPYGPTGTLRYYSVNMNATNQSFGSLAGNLALVNMTGTLTLGTNNLSTNYSGVIGGAYGTNNTSITTGTGSIVKVGSGTQTFSGPNQYTGTTSINGGTLLIGSGTGTTSSATPNANGQTASLANTAVTVGNGSTLSGTLGGNGTIGGTVTVTSTGSLAPDMTPTTSNTLTINNNLTLNAGAALQFQFWRRRLPGDRRHGQSHRHRQRLVARREGQPEYHPVVRFRDRHLQLDHGQRDRHFDRQRHLHHQRQHQL